MSLRRLVRPLRFAKRANETPPFANERNSAAPSETNETKRYVREARLVFTVLTLAAIAAFAMQAWMTFGFANEVWKMPVPLCVALVFALDVFAVMWMILSYLLRGTGWPRFAAFVVFAFAIGAQVLAAEMYGAHENWPTAVRWYSAIPAVLLALSQEGVILWRTHRGKRKTHTAPPAPARNAPAPTEAAPKPLQVKPALTPGPRPAAPRKTATPAATPRKTDSNKPDRDDIARRVIAGQLTKEDAMKEGGVGSVRAVELWVKAFRERHPESATPQLTTFPLPTQPAPVTTVNGATPKGVNQA